MDVCNLAISQDFYKIVIQPSRVGHLPGTRQGKI